MWAVSPSPETARKADARLGIGAGVEKKGEAKTYFRSSAGGFM